MLIDVVSQAEGSHMQTSRFTVSVMNINYPHFGLKTDIDVTKPSDRILYSLNTFQVNLTEESLKG